MTSLNIILPELPTSTTSKRSKIALQASKKLQPQQEPVSVSSKPVNHLQERHLPIFATSTPAKNSRPALDTSSCFACGRLSCSKIFSCEDFRSMSPNDRVRRAKEKKCCLNCLRRDHVIESCPSKRSCFVEGYSGRPKHHTLLHGADIFANQLPITPSTSHLDSVRRDAPHNIYTSA